MGLAEFLASRELFASPDSRVTAISNSHNIHENLSAEEALIRGTVLRERQGMLLLYINDPCVVVGRNQNVISEVSLLRAKRDGVKVARRSSGGGAVYHDAGNLCLSFFTTRQDYAPERTIQILRLALAAGFGFDASRFTSTSRHDLFLDGKKITGSAMRVQRDIAFHHCTLLIQSSREALGKYLKSEASTVFFKTSAVDSVRSPVTTIETELTASNANNSGEKKDGDPSLLVSLPAFSQYVSRVYHHFGSDIMKYGGDWISDDNVKHVARTMKDGLPAAGGAYYELDVNEAMKTFHYIDGEGRHKMQGSSETLREEVARIGSVAWMWNMPQFESAIAIHEAELRAALQPCDASAALWEGCLAGLQGEVAVGTQIIQEELVQYLFPSVQQSEGAEPALFLHSVVNRRCVTSISLYRGDANAELRGEDEKKKPIFDTRALQLLTVVTNWMSSLVLNKHVDDAGPLSRSKDAVRSDDSGEEWFDLPAHCQSSCAALLVEALLRVWEKKNAFEGVC